MDEAARRQRQAGYAAKHREKAKTKRRPDARAVEHAYYVALNTLPTLVKAMINRIAPDADAAAVAEGLTEAHQELALHVLSSAGYDREQCLDHMDTMERERSRKIRRRIKEVVDKPELAGHPKIQDVMLRMLQEGRNEQT